MRSVSGLHLLLEVVESTAVSPSCVVTDSQANPKVGGLKPPPSY